jgi:TolA-binding protein
MKQTVCPWLARGEVFEGYVRDTLSPEERHAFEAHYFECDTCATRLQVYQGLQTELATTATGEPARQPVRAWPWWRIAVPVAAGVLIIVAAAVLWPSRPAPVAPESTAAVGPAPAPSAAPVQPPVSAPTQAGPSSAAPAPPLVALSVLARAEAPAYLPATQLRAAPSEAAERFDAAMRRYVDGDYAGAIPGLRVAAGLRADAPQYAFFLGACQLLTDQIDLAVADFQRAIALGESPFLEEAHFYLAKARLRQGNLPAARNELARTVERRGRLEKDARHLLAQVNALIASKNQ